MVRSNENKRFATTFSFLCFSCMKLFSLFLLCLQKHFILFFFFQDFVNVLCTNGHTSGLICVIMLSRFGKFIYQEDPGRKRFVFLFYLFNLLWYTRQPLILPIKNVINFKKAGKKLP